MSENTENASSAESVSHLPATNDNPAFRADELVICQNCERGNPPTRLNCLYCAAHLPLSAEQNAAIVPVLRPLEAWEKGFNLIFLPAENAPDESMIGEIGKILRVEKDAARRFVEINKPLPLVRAESVAEAENIRQKLKQKGIETLIVGDAELAAANPPQRLRGIEFFDDQIILRLFNTDEIVALDAQDVSVIVTGAIFRRKAESIEKRKKAKTEILNSTEVSSDELLLDIYAATDEKGFRIAGSGFDFSCLDDKNILATKNMRRLTEKLREFAPAAKFVDDYAQIRHALGEIWEVEQRQDSQGLKRHGFGKFDFSRVESSSNLAQFTKYSRLQRHLL